MSATPNRFGTEHRESLERLAAILTARRDPESAMAGTRIAVLLREVAAGVADRDDPQVCEIVEAFTPGEPAGQREVEVCAGADPVEPSLVAGILDRLAAHDRGPGNGGVTGRPGPTVDPLSGPVTEPDPRTELRSEQVVLQARSGDPVVKWRQEMSELFRASPLSDPEVAAELHRRGVHVPPQTILDILDDAHAVEVVVEVLGGRWVEDNFRTLYEAARREQEPGARSAVQRSVAGLAGADPVDVARVGELIKPPVLDVPRLLSRQRLIAQLVEGLDEPKRPTQVLVGAGGYGKSIVALATAQRAEARHIMPLSGARLRPRRARRRAPPRAAIWIGSTAVEIDAALAAVGDHRVARLWALLDAAPHQWFLVLDDAGPEAVGHPGWVHRSPVGTTVVTTRYGDPATWGPDAQVIPVGVLTEEDGARLVLDRISVAGSKMAAGLDGQARRLAAAGRNAARPHQRGQPARLPARRSHARRARRAAPAGRLRDRRRDDVPDLPAVVRHHRPAPGPPPPAAGVHLRAGRGPPAAPVRRRRGADLGVGATGSTSSSGSASSRTSPDTGASPRCVRVHPAVAEQVRHDTAFDARATAASACGPSRCSARNSTYSTRARPQPGCRSGGWNHTSPRSSTAPPSPPPKSTLPRWTWPNKALRP